MCCATDNELVSYPRRLDCLICSYCKGSPVKGTKKMLHGTQKALEVRLKVCHTADVDGCHVMSGSRWKISGASRRLD